MSQSRAGAPARAELGLYGFHVCVSCHQERLACVRPARRGAGSVRARSNACSSAAAGPDFEASDEILPFIQENIRLLVVGAGGLGCELLKDLALSGFRNIDIIDI